MIKILDKENSIAGKFIAQLRNVEVQKDSLRFRRNVERIGEILGYELSKSLNYKKAEVKTPLGVATVNEVTDNIVLATVLRAGLPMHQGLFNYFDDVQNAFISAYRHPVSDDEFEIRIEYLASPSIDGKVLIMCDPMLATGRSMVEAYNALVKDKGEPSKVHIAAIIASEEGLNYVKNHMPEGTLIWIGVVDPELDEHSYIVPGLGDAGDLCYGEK